MLILEPLTIGLTIATNAAWMNHQKPEPKKNDPSKSQNLTEELKSLQKEYNLSVSKIAKITDRKKLKTIEGWLNGTIPTPPRALAKIQVWVEKEFVKPENENSMTAVIKKIDFRPFITYSSFDVALIVYNHLNLNSLFLETSIIILPFKQ